MSAPAVLATIGATPYTVTLSDGVHVWLGDEPAESGGSDTGPTPHQLLLSSLGACTAMTLKMYAARKQWPLEGVDVRLEFSPQGNGNPADKSTLITRHIMLHGVLSDEQRARLLEIANACPIHKVLTGTIRIQSDLVA